MNPKVDWYFDKAQNWQTELAQLRSIVLDCGLNEELKWGVPGYTFQRSNVLLLHVFKDYCAMLFVKGSLLADPEQMLVAQTENSQSSRQIRFTSVQQIVEMTASLKAYIYEAIEVERAGLKVELKQTSDYNVPEELQRKLNESPELKTAFDALTPGRQRGYLLHFLAPKQAKTREARIEKCIPQIMTGKGLND